MATVNSVETLFASKGTLKGARAVYVYFISTSRNEWVDWNGNTDKVQRIWRSPFPSVEAAQRAAETGRTPGSTFYIRQSVALCLEFDLGLTLIYQSDLQPLRSINKVLDDCNASRKVFSKLLLAARDSTSRFLYHHSYAANEIPSLNDFKQGDMLYSRVASGSGNKRNGLAWTLTPESIIPDTVIKLAGQIQSLLTKPVESISAQAKNASTPESETRIPAEVPAVIEHGIHLEEPSEPSAIAEPPKELSENTTREQLTRARVGQGVFRERLEAIEPSCRLTGLVIGTHLRASHIKPWRDSSDIERLDGNNGLLLSPHVDYLFDQGFITFLDDGAVLVSPSLDSKVLAAWHIDLYKHIRPLNAYQRSYMAYHRSFIFKAS